MGMFDGADSILVGDRSDDDVIDRLNHRYSVWVLLIFAFIVVDQQFIHGSKIVCWVPAHFSDYQEAYTQEYCWVRNTYYLPFHEYIPREEDESGRQMIPYYQWVPIILALQALLFNIPCNLWRTLSPRSGVNVFDFVERSQALALLDFVGAEKLYDRTLGHLASQMHRFSKSESSDKKASWTISMKHTVSKTCLRPFSRSHGRYLVALYMFCKLLYLANVVGQLFMLDALLDTNFHSYGFDMLGEMLYGNTTSEVFTMRRAFPRITMCDFKVRRLGNIQRYTVQCVLPLNLFNEKFFMVIYVWMIIVAVATLYSFIRWFIVLTPMGQRKSFIARNIVHAMQGHEQLRFGMLRGDIDIEDQEENLQLFVEKYLRQDGVFLLRLMGANVNPVTQADLIFEIWRKFRAMKGDPILLDTDPKDDDETSIHETPAVTPMPNRAGIYPRLSQMNLDDPDA